MRQQKLLPVTIIGAGKVGSALGLLLQQAGYPVVSVISRSEKSAKKLSKILQASHAGTDCRTVSSTSKIILIAVPEQEIPPVVQTLASTLKKELSGAFVFHTSGVRSSGELLPLQKYGANVFSLHPIQTFPRRARTFREIERMQGIWYGYEGNDACYSFARKLVHRMGGSIVRIPKKEKILYHVACVIASNYSITLLGVVESILKRIDNGIRLKHVAPLIESSIRNALQQSPGEALTGPIVRGSSRTIQDHIIRLKKIHPSMARLYKTIGLFTLELAKTKKGYHPVVQKEVQKILNTKEKP